MSPSPQGVAHQEARARVAEATARAARGAWRQIDRDHIYDSWLVLMARVLAIVSGGQLAAARATEPWLLALLGVDPEQAESDHLSPSALTGVDGSGRALAEVLMAPMWAALRLVTQGKPVVQSMAHGQVLLDVVVKTAVADAGRAADLVGMASRPGVTSYIRVVESGACSRCLVLAGREYGVSRAFLRHPRCHCGMEPVTRDHQPTAQDPRKVFDAMSEAQKRRTFGEAAVKAIEAGADIAQVVNARRGMASASVFGRRVLATSEGITRRGIAGRRLKNFQKVPGQRYRVARTPRLMPEEIFRLADDREHALRLLRQHGFIV
ncbi:VG15 protein [Streptomyces pacificus]|uniref:Uncharacterized protein n=1 Tax=Streptomyces pacificus TaxID=2705029 RepID=A0A6A0B2G9_9ACTN|nr:hypothetical protein [Streptomyces pacificus]GFH38905.1 hypothetical protein SCWH03_51680 [Streptomyces pacificus]